MAIDSGWNVASIDSIDVPAMFFSQDMVVVNAPQNAGRFFFFVPPGRQAFGLSLEGDKAQTSDYSLFDPSGEQGAILHGGGFDSNPSHCRLTGGRVVGSGGSPYNDGAFD